MVRRILKGMMMAALVCLTLAFLVTIFLWAQGRRTPDGRPDYVALGSSFAAGAGLGRLQPGSPLLCARSINGYPQQLARTEGLSIIDMSCGGATTHHVLEGGQFFQGPQIRVITNGTKLVTLTAGGNDIGYIGDLGLLAIRRTNTPAGWLAKVLWKGPKRADERDYGRLHAELLATLRAIHVRAPNARVVVASYPAILPPTGTCARLGLSAAEADLMREVGKRLAATTRAAASEGEALLVDMTALGAGNNACSAQPWTRGFTNGGVSPFHPTLQGARATAEAVANTVQ